MKPFLFFVFASIVSIFAIAQDAKKNVFVITLDGTRWQEIFNGADSLLLWDNSLVADTGLMRQQYWHSNPEERRRRLLPFFWQVIAKQGRMLGNRNLGNDVNVANLYKISYPGYSEIFTGYADKLFIPNLAINNPRSNILQWLNNQDAYRGKVAAFCSWRVFPFILDEKNGQLPVNAGYEPMDDNDSTNRLINDVQLNIDYKNNTRHDLLTYECAKNYLVQNHPRVLYLALGETDEYAHHGKYDTYLQKMHQADVMIAELWYYVQTDPFYKDNTTFIITTDHGRGSNKASWKKHGFWVKGSGQTWMAMIGPGVAAAGESKEPAQVYQKQIAATIADLLGVHFTATHHIGQPIKMRKVQQDKPNLYTPVAVVSR